MVLATSFAAQTDTPKVVRSPNESASPVRGHASAHRLSRRLLLVDQGTPKTPADALAFGLVDRVVAPERLLEEAVEHATRLGRRPKAGIGAVKRAVRFGGSLPLEDGLRLEAGEFLSAMSTPESIEAQRAYVDRTNELGANPDIRAAVIERGRFV